MSCGDTSWTWFRHHCSLCSVCGSVVDAQTLQCSYCENKTLDNMVQDDVYYDYGGQYD